MAFSVCDIKWAGSNITFLPKPVFLSLRTNDDEFEGIGPNKLLTLNYRTRQTIESSSKGPLKFCDLSGLSYSFKNPNGEHSQRIQNSLDQQMVYTLYSLYVGSMNEGSFRT